MKKMSRRGTKKLFHVNRDATDEDLGTDYQCWGPRLPKWSLDAIDTHLHTLSVDALQHVVRFTGGKPGRHKRELAVYVFMYVLPEALCGLDEQRRSVPSAAATSSRIGADAEMEAEQADARVGDQITMTLAEKCRLVFIVTSIDLLIGSRGSLQ